MSKTNILLLLLYCCRRRKTEMATNRGNDTTAENSIHSCRGDARNLINSSWPCEIIVNNAINQYVRIPLYYIYSVWKYRYFVLKYSAVRRNIFHVAMKYQLFFYIIYLYIIFKIVEYKNL